MFLYSAQRSKPLLVLQPLATCHHVLTSEPLTSLMPFRTPPTPSIHHWMPSTRYSANLQSAQAPLLTLHLLTTCMRKFHGNLTVPCRPNRKCLKLVLWNVLVYFTLSTTLMTLMIVTYLPNLSLTSIHFQTFIIRDCEKSCVWILMNTAMFTPQFLTNLTLCFESTRMHSFCQMPHLGIFMAQSTTYTLAMHRLATSHRTEYHPQNFKEFVIKSTTYYDKTSFDRQSLPGVLQQSLYAVSIYMANHSLPDSLSITMLLTQSPRVMAFLFHRSLISLTGLVVANHLLN